MVVFMNEADMRARGIAEGDKVEIESLAEDGKRRVVSGFWVKPTVSRPARSALITRKQIRCSLSPIMIVKSGTPAAKSIPVLVRLQAPQLDAGRMTMFALEAPRVGAAAGAMRPKASMAQWFYALGGTHPGRGGPGRVQL